MDWSWLGFGAFTLIGGYYSYKYAKTYINSYITNKVMKKLDEISNSQEIKFKQFGRHPSAVVLFEHGGKSHNICIPFDQSKARYMRRKRVFLIKEHDDQITEEIEITHKAGVPYLLSAEEMGGNKIVVRKDNNTLKEYSSSEVPKYLEDTE